MPTTPTQIRLDDMDRAKIEAIREWYGLPSASAAVRMAVNTAYRNGPPIRAGTKGKSAVKSGEEA